MGKRSNPSVGLKLSRQTPTARSLRTQRCPFSRWTCSESSKGFKRQRRPATFLTSLRRHWTLVPKDRALPG